MSRGKGKGSSFEREVCRDLSFWVSGGQRKDLFWRSAMSGGRATIGRAKGANLASQAGDIVSTDILGHRLTDKYFVEVKFYKCLDLDSFWYDRGKLFRFWEIAKREAAEYKKEPMLIAKQNFQEPLILVSSTSRFAAARFIRWHSNRGVEVGLYAEFLATNARRWL